MTTLSASATAPNVPPIVKGALSSGSQATSQGEAIYASAAEFANSPSLPSSGDLSRGSIQAMMMGAASIVNDLPAGQVQEALNEALGLGEGVLGGATAGFAVGGIYGAAIGAALGALASILSELENGGTVSPATDARSTAEQNCFPGIDETVAQGTTASSQLSYLFRPGSPADIRSYVVGLEPLHPGTEPGNPGTLSPGYNEPFLTALNGPMDFDFGVGWVSPPNSTPQTTEAAYWLAQWWLGTQGPIRPGAVTQTQYVALAQAKATTAMGGSVSAAQAAHVMLSSWYGTNFPAPSEDFTMPTGTALGTNAQGGFAGPAQGFPWNNSTGILGYAEQIANCTLSANQKNPADFIYYIADSVVNGLAFGASGWGPWTEAAVAAAGDVDAHDDLAPGGLVACPDTTICGLAEIAVMWATGVFEAQVGSADAAKTADLMALHYALGLQWLWKSGNSQDMSTGGDPAAGNATALYSQASAIGSWWGTRGHANFSRVLGIVASKIRTIYGTQALLGTGVSAPGSSGGSSSSKPSSASSGTLGRSLSNAGAIVKGPVSGPLAAHGSQSSQKSVLLLGAAAAAVWFLLK